MMKSDGPVISRAERKVIYMCNAMVAFETTGFEISGEVIAMQGEVVKEIHGKYCSGQLSIFDSKNSYMQKEKGC